MKKSSRRLVSALLVLVMIVSLLPVSVFATDSEGTGNATISVESVSAAPGSTVQVTISVTDNPGILGARLAVAFDDGLTLVDAENGEAFSMLTMTKPGRFTSPCQFVWDGQEIAAEDIRDGVILTLTFAVSENAQSGIRQNIHISYKDADFVDQDMNPLSIDMVDGGVDVIDYIPGDVNMDDDVSTTDIIVLRRYLAGGYDVSVKVPACDVNADGRVTTSDIIYYRRYLAGGYGIDKLNPSPIIDCEHNLEEIPYKAPTCTEEGNIAYWHCTNCDKYFSDVGGTTVISVEDAAIAAPGHTVVIDPAVPATTESKGLTEGSHCSVCNLVLVKQEEYGPLTPDTSNITYKMSYIETITSNGTKAIVADDYIARQVIQNEENPNTYTVGKGVAELKEPTLSGYSFLGWYDSPEIGAKRIYSISADATGDITLYGVWSQQEYKITYRLYQTPLEDTIDPKYCSYTSSRGLADLPNPTLYNYVFLGWYTNEGDEVTEIPAGTSGDLVLNAYWTSKRNLAKANKTLGDPIVFEDTDNGVIYFAYELGTIENIPLSDNIWTIQSVYGLGQQKSETYTTSLNQTRADAVSNTISNSTVDSNTWTLSEGWSDSTSVTKEWAEEHGMTVEEANEQCKSTTGTYSVTDSKGGSKSKTKTDGTTTIDYKSQNESRGNGVELGAKVSAGYTASTEVSASAGVKYGPASAEVGAKHTSTFEISGEVSGNYTQQKETNKHTGTDTTNVDTTVQGETSTWNKAETRSTTEQNIERSTVNQAISDVISSKTGYGSSYTANGENSKTQGFGKSSTDSVNSSSSLTWSSVKTKTVTSTYSVDGKRDGCYRLVIAGTAHVFGVVGYDVGTKSFFTYSYSIMDDKQYEFLDYSPDLAFNDCENSVLPFEIPYDVFEYAASATVRTEGLGFTTNSSTKTARLFEYTGDSTDVTVPDYITSGGVAYKVTEFAPAAFAEKNIRAIKLSKYIEKLPAGAFKNCSNLKQVSGYYSVIGDEAFSGCTSLENYNITVSTKSIGKNAFLGVPSIVMNAISEAYALEASSGDKAAARALTQELIDSALNSGAHQVVLSLNDIVDGCELTLEVPSMERFELVGCIDIKKMLSYSNLRLVSSAETTVLRNLKITDCTRIPLEIASSALTLEVVDISSVGSCLLLPNQATITLIKDNNLASQNGKTVICAAPTFVSKRSDGIAGYLKVTGNIYAYGTVTGRENVVFEDGDVIPIATKDEFDNYIKGAFTVSFNINGGNALSDAEKTIYFGSKYGSLPTPTREHYNFDGWYTAAAGGMRITADDTFNGTSNITLYAHWSPKTFTVTLNANGGSCSTSSKAGTYGVSIGTIPNPVRDYYTFDGWYTSASGGNLVTESTVFSTSTDVTIYAHWSPIAYKATWNTGTGYQITVSRTSSPNAGAPTGTLSSGAAVYYGDILNVNYTAQTGYSLSSTGEKSISVNGDVTASRIYASANANSYTYNVVYQSVNGTALGKTTVTNTYGTTNTISAPAYNGYITPGAQQITWDSTSAKTITFAYTPSSVGSTVKTGTAISSPKITYSATLEHRNRTATSVEFRVTWTATIEKGGYDAYGQRFEASCGSNKTGAVQIVKFGTWSNSSSKARSATATSDWVTVPVSTTNATSLSIDIHYYQVNSPGSKMGTDMKTTWQMEIPAY